MKITGLITEYNPFHNGHLYHLNSGKRDTNCQGVISIMSGNYMQRGNPAMIDKWNRAKMAVLNGVDLVIELPLIYSLASAETFAFGACNILNSTNVVDYLYFGSEEGNIEDLSSIASLLINEKKDFKNSIKEYLYLGLPYHTARANTICKILKDDKYKNILNNSNNILSIEYLKALKKLNSSIVPLTLKREGSNYNDNNLHSSLSSATSIRKVFKENLDINLLSNSLPEESFNLIKSLKDTKYSFVFDESFFPYLKYKLLTEGNNIVKLQDVSEGIENKILKEIVNSNSLDELISKVKSKRYTYTRINRILTSFFIGLDNYNLKELYKEEPKYIRPLAFNETGRKILKLIKENSDIKIITKVGNNDINNPCLSLDILGTKSYSLLNKSINPLDDYLKSPIFLK